ncbi:hypothetical protein AKJ65_02080 [candidate division MSBL1 archaeon SCGC-AAA259E19]|uniref:ABC transmembrane type-1 domain-containing protein n=1 Tax=candidate division MSBL1 archaeon SCGC-AAA259E19 TaxID=1698264 RepID=A0A133UM33_9EURY|nr:hypothetical protein AKJ65_02080 [candidate division MSBL1 archaeon SCGC-AAA259E19]
MYLTAAVLVIFFVFIIPRLMPSNPIQILMAQSLSGGGGNAAAMRDMLMERYALNAPLLTQLEKYLTGLINLDLGQSIAFWPQSVVSLILEKLPWTLLLVIIGLITSYYGGAYLGSLVSYSDNKILSYFYNGLVTVSRTPVFWFGMLLLYLFAYKFEIFPSSGAYSADLPLFSINGIISLLHHLILPLLSITIVVLGYFAFSMRSMMTYEVETDYVKYSRGLGFSNGKLRSYSKDNAIIPLFSQLPIQFNALVGYTIVAEIAFNYPGLGFLMLRAINNQDYPLIQGTVLFLAFVVLIGNFLIDLAYSWVDPRIRKGYSEG